MDQLKKEILQLIALALDEETLPDRDSFLEMEGNVIHFAGDTDDPVRGSVYFRVDLVECDESEFDGWLRNPNGPLLSRERNACRGAYQRTGGITTQRHRTVCINGKVFKEYYMETIMEGVTEYGEGYDVLLNSIWDDEHEQGRLVVQAFNEGGHNSTQIDLLELLEWVRKNQPGLLGENDELYRDTSDPLA